MSTTKRDYVDVIYNEQDRPITIYPQQLARHLFDRFHLKVGDRLLEIGCGRGEFLCGFIKCGVSGYGVDRSNSAERYCPEAVLKICDLENDRIPHEDDFFDVVYSKSVIEHFYYPERVAQEVFRVLKPGGLAITLCPDWEFNYKIYFEDYTHRTPFTKSSLRDIHLIHGFEHVTVDRFRQLPILWGSGKWLLPLAEVTRILAPAFFKPYSKWVRFSRKLCFYHLQQSPYRNSRKQKNGSKSADRVYARPAVAARGWPHSVIPLGILAK